MKLPLPELPAFKYHRASSVENALEQLGSSDARTHVLLGGTDLFVQMRAGVVAPEAVIDLKNLPDFRRISFDYDSGLRIGAAATMNAVADHPDVKRHYPLLVEAIETIASYQLRNRATIGGNLCNASPAADSAPPLLVLNSHVTLESTEGQRQLNLNEFFEGPGKTALESSEIMTMVHVPVPPTGWKGRYLKLGRNASGDLAIVGVAVLGYPDPETSSGFQFRIALASVAPTPLRVTEAEKLIAGTDLSDESIERAARIAQNTAKPISDARASAEYRSAMVYELTVWGLNDVKELLMGED